MLGPKDTFSAHPRIDSKTGRLINFSAAQGTKECELTIHEFAPDTTDITPVKTKKFTVPGFVFFHDFVVTENYYIFNQAPVDFDPIPFVLGQKGPAECIDFNNKRDATIWFIPRNSDTAGKLEFQRSYRLYWWCLVSNGDSSHVLLPYSITPLASPMTNILISTIL